MRHGLGAEGIEYVAFGSDGGALDLLLGVAGDEEEGYAFAVGASDRNRGGGDLEHPGRGDVYPGGWLAGVAVFGDAGDGRSSADVAVSEAALGGGGNVDDGGGDEAFSVFERWRNDEGGVRRDGDLEGEEAAGGFGERGVGASVGPAAAEGDVDAEAEPAAFGLGVVDGLEHCGG